jgi:hypothetical protein
MRFELAGNRMRVRRPPSVLTNAHETLFGAMPMAEARPTSNYAIAQSQADADRACYVQSGARRACAANAAADLAPLSPSFSSPSSSRSALPP